MAAKLFGRASAAVLVSCVGLAPLAEAGQPCDASAGTCRDPAAADEFDEDESAMLQRNRPQAMAVSHDPVREVASSSLWPPAGSPGGEPQLVKPGEMIPDFEGESAQKLVDWLFEPKELPSSSRHCKDGLLDCLDPDKKKRCPATCEIQEEMLGLMDGRSHDVPKARLRLVSRLTSRFESSYKKLHGGKKKQLPGWHQAALTSFDAALARFARCTDPKEKQAHQTALGYPLTVIEAIMYQLNLTNAVSDPPRDTVYSNMYINFAETVEKYGWDSREAHDFYERGIYLTGDGFFPVDAGWINKWVGNLRVYTQDWGLHTYRKVPFKLFPWPSYDMDFSVHRLADHKPLKIGIVGDWGSGTPQAIKLIREMKKQNVDMVIHLGDVYYSGTVEEQRQFFVEPMRAVFGEHIPILTIPGNHDYYDGGKGFFDAIDDLGVQQASYFCLRGKHWQILAIDTGLMDNFDLLFNVGNAEIDAAMENTMTFLPEDQFKWARHQLDVGKKKGLKTIMMSHHQLFSNKFTMGVSNSFVKEASTVPDRLAFTYYTNEFNTNATELPPGGLTNENKYPVNARLASQFPASALEDVAAWFWGHEHSAVMFEPHEGVGLTRGRCLGNGAFPEPATVEPYTPDEDLDGSPWGGLPKVMPGTRAGKGDAFWNLGFATIELSGSSATARYFHMQDTYAPPNPPTWGSASEYYSESLVN